MVKHITARFGWHDNRWNGTICKDPKNNFYCRDNYSLLSPRIQKRINLDVEDSFKEKPISETLIQNYVPPCYWSINAFGKSDFKISDPHPFVGTSKSGKDFEKNVPPIINKLKKFSIMSWAFQIGYAKEGKQRYVPVTELDQRVKSYLNQISKGKSIVFFYSNFSNPLTGDDYKYALLGAGIVEGTEEPKHYQIPDSFLVQVRDGKGMGNFPTMAWQFQINLQPENTFLLPFHDYLDWIEEEDDYTKNEKWKMLREVVIAIEGNLVPNFKYVSMHVNHDKAIYLLYLIQKSVRKMKEHNIIKSKKLEEIEQKLEKTLTIAWKERTKYPGFENSAYSILQGDFAEEQLKEIIPLVV